MASLEEQFISGDLESGDSVATPTLSPSITADQLEQQFVTGDFGGISSAAQADNTPPSIDPATPPLLPGFKGDQRNIASGEVVIDPSLNTDWTGGEVQTPAPASDPTLDPPTPADVMAGVAEVAESESLAPQPASQLTSVPPYPGDPRNLNESGTAFTEAGFQAEYGRFNEAGERIELDTQTGVGFVGRFLGGLTDDPETRRDLLNQQFKNIELEELPDGNTILRGLVDPATGKEKDLLFDERGGSLLDLFDIGGLIVEMAAAAGGTALALKSGPGAVVVGQLARQASKGALKRGAIAVAGAVLGQKTAQVGSDVLTGAAARQDLGKIGERIQARAKSLKTEVAAEITMSLLPAGLKKVIDTTLIQGKGSVIREGLAAAQRLKEKSGGLGFDFSLGQLTGSPTLQGAEIFAGKFPSAKSIFLGQERAREKQMEELQAWILTGRGKRDLPDLPFDDEVNRRAVTRVAEEVRAVERTNAGNLLEEIRKSNEEIREIIRMSSPKANAGLSERASGGLIRWSANAEKLTFSEISDELYARIALKNPRLPIKNLKEAAEKIRKALIKKTQPEKVVEETSLILDDLGRPITTTVTTGGGRVPNEKLIPSDLMRRLAGIAELDDLTPLNEIRSLRTSLFDSLSATQVLDDTSSKMRKDLAAALTRSLDEGLAQVTDPALRESYEAANKFYKRNVGRLQDKRIISLLADETQTKLGPREIFDETLTNEDQYFKVKELLTKKLTDIPPNADAAGLAATALARGEETFDTFKRTALSAILNTTEQGAGIVNLKDFVTRLHGLKSNSMVADMLGEPQWRALQDYVNEGAALMREGIPNDEIIDLITNKQFTKTNIKTALSNVKQKNKLFRNGLIDRLVKAQKDGTDISTIVSADDFVNKVLTGSLDEVREVVAILEKSPGLMDDVRSLTVEQLFKDSARSATAEDSLKLLKGDRVVAFDGQKLTAEIRGGERKLRSVLGFEIMNDLDDLARVQIATVPPADVSAQAGGIAAGGVITKLFKLQWGSAYTHIKYRLAATLLTSPRIRELAKRTEPDDFLPFIRTAMAGGVVLESLAKDYNPAALASAYQAIDEFLGDEEDIASRTFDLSDIAR